MRMRKKKKSGAAHGALCCCVGARTAGHHGHWRALFEGNRALHVELGCGKGRFTAETALKHPDTLFLAVERVPDAMVVAMERVCSMGPDQCTLPFL